MGGRFKTNKQKHIIELKAFVYFCLGASEADEVVLVSETAEL